MGDLEEATTKSSEITEEDVVKTKEILDEINHRGKDCAALVAALTHKIKSKELPTGKGISFLEMKNHSLLQYLLGLGGIILTKVAGKSIQERSFVDQLIELRVVMEKIRPIDNKLKYQIDKLIRSASDKKVDSESDPLMHKANLDNLSGDSDIDDEPEGPSSSSSKKDVYVPPKVAAQPYDDDEETPAKQMEKVKKKSINRTLIRELQEEYLETPTEIFSKAEGSSGDLSRHVRDKQRYEETYMTRLPETKKDKHIAKTMSTIGVLGDEITDFRPKRRSGGANSQKKSTKRKKSGGSSGGTKKKFRKK